MTQLICSAHRELFTHNATAAQQAFWQLTALLRDSRQNNIDAPWLAIHHARLEIVLILLKPETDVALNLLRYILIDLAQARGTLTLTSRRYFLDAIQQHLSVMDEQRLSHPELQHLYVDLMMMIEIDESQLCRALPFIGDNATHQLS